MFDPYRKWLGIPEHLRPPTHYQILGISPDERDLDVIEAAVLRQSAFVRNFQAGAHADEATRILNEIAAARLCLIDPKKRAKYDADTAKHQAPGPASHSSARHSDLAIDLAAASAAPSQRAPAPASRRPSPPPTRSPVARSPDPSAPAPAIDLDQLMAPAPRRAASAGRRTGLTNRSLPGRRRAPQSSVGYLWQVPLLAVIVIVLLLAARAIGRTIAEQRAQRATPVQTEIDSERN
ncbi:MAG TPA: hypothetical protein VG125_26670 [Pirellulales bacterium]|jgi:hypothetical protein|nr:hypothetical protein [Pirellulales bacterium]